MPGPAERIPGVSSGPAGGFAAGECLDVAAGSAALHGFIEKAADSGRLAEASCPAPGPCSGTGGCGTPKSRSSPARPPPWTPAKPARPSRRCWGQAPGLSPGRLRNAIKRAVARVAPRKAKDRREHGAKNARVERWQEDLLLNYDSRPAAVRGTTPADDGADHPAGPYQAPGTGPGSGGGIPAGFAGRNHLTVPLATLLGLADRPGELPGPNPAARHLRGQIRPGSPSPGPGPGRPAGTGPGGSPPGSPASGPGSSPSTRSRPATATTATRPAATTLERRTAPRRHLHLDHPERTPVHHRTHRIPHLTTPPDLDYDGSVPVVAISSRKVLWT